MATTTSLTRSLPAGALICRGGMQLAIPQQLTQRRWVGSKYLLKMQVAEARWKAKAEEIKDGTRKNLFDELEERGFIKDVVGRTKAQMRETFRVKRVSAYAGVDPTASSLHLGHLLAFMPLFWMYIHGYGAFTIIGSSTAKIGDPTGRTKDRPTMSQADLVQNLAGIHHQLKSIWVSVEKESKRFGYHHDWAWRRGIVNNNAWWNSQPMLEVLKRLGNFIRLGPLLGRDNVKTRLEDGHGMSVSEFLYPLMQGWDWFTMYKQRGVQMQIGGSDQYGNILTGIECVKSAVKSEADDRIRLPSGVHDQPMGFTVPLLTDASGAKFGKSAGNAMWLDPFQTTPYDLYGYLVRRSDDEIERLLKLFTFHPLEKIAEVMAQHTEDPRKRVAQHLLAHEVLVLVHGKAVADRAQEQHKAMYGAAQAPEALEPSGAVAQDPSQYELPQGKPVEAIGAPRVDMKLPRHLLNQSLARMMFAAGLATSIGDADRQIKNGGLYLGGRPGAIKGAKYQYGMIPEQLMFTPVRGWLVSDNEKYLIDDKIMLMRKGKHNLRCIEFVSDEEWEKLGMEYPGQPNKGAFRKAVGKMNDMLKVAEEKKIELQIKDGKKDVQLRDEDKVKEVALNAEISPKSNELLVKALRKGMQQASEAGLVKEDPDKW